jgi:hypothetical protein
VGGGATGGGAAGGEQPGTVTFDQLAFNYQSLVSGPDGVLHLTFVDGPTPDSSFRYARCAQNCGVGSNWTVTTIDTGAPTKSDTRLVIGTDGRLHALYETYELSNTQTIYSSCASNCTVATNWSKNYLTQLINGSSAAYRGAPLVIDSQNRLSFIVSTKTINATLTLATCAANCDTFANWTAGTFRTGGGRVAMAARGTTLHAVLYNELDSLVYRTCASNCTVATNWQESPPLFIHDGSMPATIAVTAQGGVRVAYNQGISASNQSPAIKAQDQRVLVWSCDANCLVPTSWAGVIVGTVRDGEEGMSLAEQSGALVVVTTNTIDATYLLCTSGCTSDANWARGFVDSTAAFSAGYPPATYAATGCSAQPYFAAWYLDEGVVAIRPDGSVAAAFSSHMLRQCNVGMTTSTYLPGFGRVVFQP